MSKPCHPSSSQANLEIQSLPDEWVRVRVDGQDYVIAAACPHRKGRLVYGYVNVRRRRITCPLHGSTFDLATGCSVAGPTANPLPVRHTRASCLNTGPTAEDHMAPGDSHLKADTAIEIAHQRQHDRSRP